MGILNKDFKNWSKKKKIGVSLAFGVFFLLLLSGGGDSQKDLLDEISKSSDSQKIAEMAKEFEKNSDILNDSFVECTNDCNNKSATLTISNIKKISSKKYPFRGTVFSSLGKKQGVDLNFFNVFYDEQSKSFNVKIGKKVKKVPENQLLITNFNVSGFFKDNHLVNHDVEGYITSIVPNQAKINQLKEIQLAKEKKRQEDEEKRKKIKEENERKEILRQAEIEKKRAKKLNMTISQYRNYKSQVKLCKTDWKKCTDNKMLVNEFDGIVKIKTACKLQANSQAKYGDPQWKWITFGTFLKGNDYIKNGLVVLFDNQVKFQNGFGAYKKTEVECIYSLKSNKITALRIN